LFRLKPQSEDEVRAFVARQSRSSFSYPEVGATAGGPPDRYDIDRNRVRLGQGEAVWSRAVEAVRAWQMFNIPWLTLYWPDAPIRPGTDVAVLVRHFGFWSLNACRIAYVVEDETSNGRRYGFAYGTLSDHAEQGEERFTVEWTRTDNTVWYDILAFSRPKKLLAKMAYPLSRSLQRRFAVASKAAMLAAVCPLPGVGERNSLRRHFVPPDRTIAELERKAADCEQQAANAEGPLAAELLREADRCREWAATLRSGRWTS
jgi:uncharacterized protein (UPF0548 family)